MTVPEELITLIAMTLGVDSAALNQETKSGDIPQWDSLGHLRVCMAIEDRFKVSIPATEIQDLDSVAALHAKLASLASP